MRLISFFSSAGGPDKGSHNTGFRIIVANEFSGKICPIFRANFPGTRLTEGDIHGIPSDAFPMNPVGIIGGPPCQSWSKAGTLEGIKDTRGQLSYEYIRIPRDTRPSFFVAENVPGMLAKRHTEAVRGFVNLFNQAGCSVNLEMLNANDFDVPEDRNHVFYIDSRKDSHINDYEYPLPQKHRPVLREAIWDLQKTTIPVREKNHTNGDTYIVPNNEYSIGAYSPIFMSRNRIHPWDKPGFTVQTSGRRY